MDISDDDANMIAGRIFDAIESKGVFNRQLVATEIKAGLALVKPKPMVNFISRPGQKVREFVDGQEMTTGFLTDDQIRKQADLVERTYREIQERAIYPAYYEPSEVERLIVKGMEELTGMPLSPGKRDPDGTAHYRLPDTRKRRVVRFFGRRFEVPDAMGNQAVLNCLDDQANTGKPLSHYGIEQLD